jgi:hypothetical protein
MDTPAVGVAQKEDRERGIDQQDVFHRMVFFLAAITRGLFNRVLGADDASFGAVMGKRGDAGTVVGRASPGTASSSRGMTTGTASPSETPKRCARAVRERVGASPRARRAANNAGKRTWIH